MVVVFAIATALAAHTLWFRPLRIEWFFARIFIEDLLADPERRALQPIFPNWLDQPRRQLSDLSTASAARSDRRAVDRLAILRGYDCTDFAPAAAESCAVLDYALSMQAEGARWRLHDLPVNPIFGVQNTLPGLLIAQHPIASLDDAEDYLARLGAVPAKIDSLLQALQAREQAGLMPPRQSVDAVLAQMQQFVMVEPEAHPLVTQFAARLSELPAASRSDSTTGTLLANARERVEFDVLPAWRRLIEHFQRIRPRAAGNDGAWSRPDGDAYYAFMVRFHTTTTLVPEAVHRIGLQEVARLETRIDRQLRQLGRERGGVGERFAALAMEPGQRFNNDRAGRAAIVAQMQAMIATATKAVPRFFAASPAIPLKVERLPSMREPTAPLAFYAPPSRGRELRRGGVIYLNLRNVDELPRFSLPALAFHEGIPGHHLQSVIQLAQDDLPAFRQQFAFSAFAEGWAMYAEQLAVEMGLVDDPWERLGVLQSELFRATRLVVDTGLHYKRWSRERAIDYLRAKTGLAVTDAVAEVDRYLIFPGQALSFSIGLKAFRAARAKAQAKLGQHFDLTEFHAAVLNGGRVPLAVLEQRVDRYIEAKGRSR